MLNGLLRKTAASVIAVSMLGMAAAPAGAATVEQLLAQLAALQAQLAALQAAEPAPAPAVTFNRNLRLGLRGDDVRALQEYLRGTGHFPAGQAATGFFGPITRTAVAAWQAANGLPATGFFGPMSRARHAALTAPPVVIVPPVVPPVDPPAPPVTPVEPAARLSAVTPAAATLPQNARMVPLLTVDISAGREDLTISEMRFRRTGLGVPGDWTDLHLFEGDVRLTDFGRSISVDTHLAEFPGLTINIPAGQTKSYTLRANIGTVAGRQGAFELVGVTSNIAVPGLPIIGNLMSIGGVGVSTVTLRAGLSLTNPMVGAQDVEIASFRVEAGTDAVAVEQIAVTVGGTIRRGDVTNLELFHGTTRLAATPALNVRDQAVFVLSPRLNIERNRGEVLTVRADLAGRVTERVESSIARSEDIIAIDQALGFGAMVSLISPVATAGGIGNIVLQGGRLTLTDRGPAARNIALNTNDVVLAEVGMTADRNVEVRRITVALPGMPAGITDLRIKDAATGATLMGPVAAPTVAAQNIDGSFTLTAGVARNIVVTVDTGATAGSFSANVTVPFGNVRDIGTGAWLTTGDVVPATITGKTQTVVATSLTVGLAAHPISATTVAGSVNVPAVGFSLAAVGTDVTVRSLEARVFVNTTLANLTAAGATEVAAPNTVVALSRLMDGATVLSSRVLSNVVVAEHDYGLARFDGLNLRIPRDTTRTLTVQISTASGMGAHFVAVSVLSANVDAIDLDGRTVTPGVITVNALAGAGTPRVTTVVAAGTLGAGISPATPITAIVPVGNTVARVDVPVTAVRYTATNEPIILEEIRVTRAGTNTPTTFMAVDIWDGTREVASVPFPADAAVTTTTFSGLNIEVPTTGHRELTFRADLAAVGQGALTGQTVKLDVEVIRARGRDSGTLLTAMGGNITAGNTLTIRQTVPTVATVRGATTLLRNGENHLMTVTVTADSRGDVSLRGFGAIGIAITQGGGATTTISDFIVRSAGVVVADPVSATAITFTTPEAIAAGASRTYEIFAVVAGADHDADTIVSNLTVAGFAWRDAAVATDIDGTSVITLPSPSFTLSFR
jgi:peptidoglycan hydrolase-like protein with peptidoglycan-binding domain